MGQRTSQPEPAERTQSLSCKEADDAVFDSSLLQHYTMHNQGLAIEVLNLFLAQLPATLALLGEARTGVEWKFATHALKGSAAAVGAEKLRRLAAELEMLVVPGDDNVRLLRLQALKAAAAEFREAARRAYPALG